MFRRNLEGTVVRRKKEVERWVDSGGIIACGLHVKLVIVVPRKHGMVVRWREAAIQRGTFRC